MYIILYGFMKNLTLQNNFHIFKDFGDIALGIRTIKIV